MKNLCIVVFLALILTGCSGAAWETVDDVLPVETVPVWQKEAYEILLGIPEGVSLLAENETGAFFATDHGELEIETATFLASGVEQAIRHVSGFSNDQLTILKTQRFGLPEYQFAWVAQTEQGARLYRADLVMDGTCCYAVVCSNLETGGDQAAFQARQVFSTFGLYQDEGV